MKKLILMLALFLAGMKTVSLNAAVSEISSIQAYTTPTIVEFYHPRCGACMAAAPKYNALSNKLPNVTFLKINIGTPEGKNALNKYAITATPTFIIFNNGSVQQKVVGGDDEQFKAIEKGLKSL